MATASYPMEHWEIKVELARAIRYHLFKGDKKKACMWCTTVLEIDEATIEHIVPHSHGGPLSVENAGVACSSCNQKRGTRTPEEFQASAWLLEKRRQVLAQKNNRKMPKHQDGMEMSEEEIRLASHMYLNLLTKQELSAIIMGIAKQGHLDRWASIFMEINQ